MSIKLKTRRGAAGSQYALIVGLIGVVALLAVANAGSSISQLLGRTANALCGATNDGCNSQNGSTGGGAGGGAPAAAPTLKLYGGSNSDNAKAIVSDGGGGYFIVGSTYSVGSGNDDVGVIHIDADGAVLWAKAIGGAALDRAYGAVSNGSGGVVIAGGSASGTAGGEDLIIFSMSGSGTINWANRLGGTGTDDAFGIARDGSGGYYVVGYTSSAGLGGTDILAARYTSAGALSWVRTYGGASGELAYSVAASGNDLFITGSTSSNGPSTDIALVSLSSTGGINWARSIGGSSYEYGLNVISDGGTGAYIVGYTGSVGAGSVDVILLRSNDVGTLTWSRALGGSGGDYGMGVGLDSGGVLLTGYTASFGGGSNNALLARFSASGTLDYAHTLGTTVTDVGRNVLGGSGGPVLIGDSDSAGAGYDDMMFARFDSNGALAGNSWYNDWTTVTVTNPSWTSATWSGTIGTPSLTSATWAPTITNWTPTVTTVP